MKRFWLVLVICVIALDVGRHATQGLLGAINRGFLKRCIADGRSLATAIDSYKAAHGSYPVAMSAEQLGALLIPAHLRVIPSEVHYFSDGSTYSFVLWSNGSSPYSTRNSVVGPLEFRDGVLVAWPDWADPIVKKGSNFK